MSETFIPSINSIQPSLQLVGEGIGSELGIYFPTGLESISSPEDSFSSNNTEGLLRGLDYHSIPLDIGPTSSESQRPSSAQPRLPSRDRCLLCYASFYNPNDVITIRCNHCLYINNARTPRGVNRPMFYNRAQISNHGPQWDSENWATIVIFFNLQLKSNAVKFKKISKEIEDAGRNVFNESFRIASEFVDLTGYYRMVRSDAVRLHEQQSIDAYDHGESEITWAQKYLVKETKKRKRPGLCAIQSQFVSVYNRIGQTEKFLAHQGLIKGDLTIMSVLPPRDADGVFNRGIPADILQYMSSSGAATSRTL